MSILYFVSFSSSKLDANFQVYFWTKCVDFCGYPNQVFILSFTVYYLVLNLRVLTQGLNYCLLVLAFIFDLNFFLEFNLQLKSLEVERTVRKGCVGLGYYVT